MHFLTAPSSSLLSPHLTPSLFCPPLYFSSASTGRLRRFALLNEPGSVLNCYKGLCWSCSGFLRRCKDWEGEFSSLESQILEFMQGSDKPGVFPTKEELVAAGRVDLVNAIVNEGGWLAFGWDLNDGDKRYPECYFLLYRKIETGESGIEGILNRLEKQRNSVLGLGLIEKEDGVFSESNEDKDEWDHRTTMNALAAGLENSSRASSLSPTSTHLSGSRIKHDQHGLGSENLRNSLEPEMWRSWIIQRTGVSDADFEDAEIVPGETQKGGISGASGQPDILNGREFSSELINKETGLYSLDGNANNNDIKSRIQHLKLELSSVLHSLRSSTDITAMQTDPKHSSDNLAKLSDAWEFQENEMINAQDRLRSIRAKLAVLEGKMALAIMDAHKVVEEKQKKINNAQKALQMLKTTCVIWPTKAEEVLLTGSFDGWSTKRKLEKLSSGMFSVNLLLYPGRYEMKFIVDGEWKVDPLRPVVTSHGYENNLLIISD
uniref:5'-AMP-activated protein kinase subunit beta-2 n=1 Tax=Cajanus cajan TaxID=3821 RepID=A0A151SZL4_CAJCA|nr:5'-AMP-activated protein kinase subunit beta-2 [Cajanus cajan]